MVAAYAWLASSTDVCFVRFAIERFNASGWASLVPGLKVREIKKSARESPSMRVQRDDSFTALIFPSRIQRWMVNSELSSASAQDYGAIIRPRNCS